MRTQQKTLQGAGYHGANFTFQNQPAENYVNATTALANLATATTSDREAFATMTATVDALTTQLHKKEDYIRTLEQRLNPPRTANLPTNTGTTGHTRPSNRREPPPADANESYCHTHGHCVGATHNSATCTWPDPNHQKTATKQNTMGGKQD